MKRFRNFPLSYESRITADETGFSLSISSAIYVLYMYYTFLRYFPNLSIPNFSPFHLPTLSHREPRKVQFSIPLFTTRIPVRELLPKSFVLLYSGWNGIESNRGEKRRYLWTRIKLRLRVRLLHSLFAIRARIDRAELALRTDRVWPYY